MNSENTDRLIYTAKDFETDQEVRWCPGCGDYSVLKSVQKILPQTGYKKEDIVFVSGIGCSSRFPYYVDTYGIHSIHGRAFSVATGLKITRPELQVWVITGDGDGLSIGGNHLIHICRRNPNLNILLFNNQIYGLTKGQSSPTSSTQQVTRSTPFGHIEEPFNPISLVLGAKGSFVARTADRLPSHMQEILLEADKYKGTSFVEIYQNCNIFNDGAFELFTDKQVREDHSLILEEGKPLIYGKDSDKTIILDGHKPKLANLSEAKESALWIHDSSDAFKADMLAKFSDLPGFPRPFGIFYKSPRPVYEEVLYDSIERLKPTKKSMDEIIAGKSNWEV